MSQQTSPSPSTAVSASLSATTSPVPPTRANPTLDQVLTAVAKRHFCTIATVSSAQRPHSAGVMYDWHDGALYLSTHLTSRKGRNLLHQPRAHVSVPVRRAPVGPPSQVSFAATAQVLAANDPEVTRLASSGAISTIIGHGELELPDTCVVRLTPTGPFHTYGIGLSLWSLVRHPLEAMGRVERPS